MQTFIETDRLILREMMPTDVEGMFKLDSDPEVHRFLGNQPVSTYNESEKIIDHIRTQYQTYGIGRWAVIEKSSQQFIGWAGLKFVPEIINNHTKYYDLGYRFIKACWGKGYATEVASASLSYGFNQLHQQHIYAMADTNNQASIHVLEKAGFKRLNQFELNGISHCWFEARRPD